MIYTSNDTHWNKPNLTLSFIRQKKPIDVASGYGILLDRLFRVNLTGKFAYGSHLNRVRD